MAQLMLFNGPDVVDGAVTALWVTDGTSAGTHELSGIVGADPSGGLNPQDFTSFNGEVIFQGTDAAGLRVPWITDGTVAGTHELVPISNSWPLGPGMVAQYFANLNGKVIFRGIDSNPDYGKGLWVTNGTGAGTSEIGGLEDAGVTNAWANGLDPTATIYSHFTVYNNKVYFMARDNANGPGRGGVGLWATDGTAQGTVEIAPITNAAGAPVIGYDIQPQSMTVANGKLMFAGADTTSGGTRLHLWTSNGTAAGTVEVGGLNDAAIAGASTDGLSPFGLFTFGNKVLFAGYDNKLNVFQNPYNSVGLWISDGTAAGTIELGGLVNAGIAGASSAGLFATGGLASAGVAVSFPDFTLYNGQVIFQAVNASSHVGLWLTDGTVAGTHEITGIAGGGPSLNGLNNPEFTVLNNKVYFQAGNTIWVTDGTAAGTHQALNVTGVGIASNGFLNMITFDPTAASVGDATLGILRSGDNDTHVAQIAGSISSGQLTLSNYINQLIGQAQSTTIPSLAVYDFFFGTLPSSVGLDFLTNFATQIQSPSGGGFSVVNTFVNFAATDAIIPSNTFIAQYGAAAVPNEQTFFTNVYTQLFGHAPSAAAVNNYFQTQTFNLPNGMTIVGNTFDFYREYVRESLPAAQQTATNLENGARGAVVGTLMYFAEADATTQYEQSTVHFLQAAGAGTEHYQVPLVGTYLAHA